MVDFHSHILPKMDDGSQSIEESIQMLTALKNQGVDTVCLTSHFYGSKESPENFLKRREASFEALKEALPEGLPKLKLGAEVLFYRGVSRMEQLPLLRLQDTDILLLEMPFTAWSDYDINEVLEIQNSGKAIVMLAHIERYFAWQNRKTWDVLLGNGVIMQSNAEFFFEPGRRRQAVKMYKQGRVHFLGSDAHNLGTRAPKIGEALQFIEKKLGPDAAYQLKESSDRLLRERSL